MRLFTLIVCSLFTSYLLGQNIIVSGKIVDQDTQKPISYAHVGIPEKGIGTTSGDDGRFTFKVPIQYHNSTLMVSFMGYKTYRKSLKNVKSPITISIKKMPLDLIEIVVMDEKTIEDIIRKAVRRIPDNYPTHPTTSLGFYRESRTNENNEYIYLAEGVLNVRKTSYAKEKEGQTTLVQGRQVRLVPPEEFSQYSGFTAGHMAGHRFDFVKNREDFINENYFPAYKYWLEGITYHQDQPVYIIGFDGEEDKKDGRMEGRIYIDTLSHAFLRAEFKIKEKGLRKISDYPLYSGSWKGNRYVVNYRKLGDKWYYGDALREGLYRDGGVYSNEILITEMDGKRSGPLPYQERLSRNSRFLDITGDYDEDFWRDYNTMPLNASLQNSLQQEKTNRIAQEVFDSTFLANLQRERDSLEALKARELAAQLGGFDNLEGIEGLEDLEDIEDLKDIANMKNLKNLRTLRKLQKSIKGEEEKSGWRFQANLGLGAHLLDAKAGNMTLTYLTKEDAQPIISVSEDVKDWYLEPLVHFDGNIFFHKNFFFRFGFAGDLWTNIYKKNNQGFGAQVNLFKRKRPFFVRAVIEHGNLKYARKIGQATNDYGDFKARRKKFKSEKINMYYGSRTHSLEGTLELAIEVNPNLEIFGRGTYSLPFARQQHIYLWERKRLFRKKRRIPLNDQIIVEQEGAPYRGKIIEEHPIFISFGLVFKG